VLRSDHHRAKPLRRVLLEVYASVLRVSCAAPEGVTARKLDQLRVVQIHFRRYPAGE
jgi:hypothetical protein